MKILLATAVIASLIFTSTVKAADSLAKNIFDTQEKAGIEFLLSKN